MHHRVHDATGGEEDRDLDNDHENREPVSFHEVSGYIPKFMSRASVGFVPSRHDVTVVR